MEDELWVIVKESLVLFCYLRGFGKSFLWASAFLVQQRKGTGNQSLQAFYL
jgi:hypothetical protein